METYNHIHYYSFNYIGTISVYSWGSIWFIPIYLCYCMFWGGADAIWHECGHRTAFKTRKLK